MFRSLRTSVVASLPLLAALACAPSGGTAKMDTAAAPNPAAVRATIDSLNARQIAAFNAHDTAGTYADYATDAIFLAPNEPAWRGHDAIAKGMTEMMGTMKPNEFSFKTEDFVTSGDLAVESGSYSMTVQPAKGKETKDEGKYVTVWQKQPDGSWKRIRDISNTNLPMK